MNMNYTAGPWAVVSTVSNDRKNLFGTAPYREYHIGTFVSGSRRDVDILKSNVALGQRQWMEFVALRGGDAGACRCYKIITAGVQGTGT